VTSQMTVDAELRREWYCTRNEAQGMRHQVVQEWAQGKGEGCWHRASPGAGELAGDNRTLNILPSAPVRKEPDKELLTASSWKLPHFYLPGNSALQDFPNWNRFLSRICHTECSGMWLLFWNPFYP